MSVLLFETLCVALALVVAGMLAAIGLACVLAVPVLVLAGWWNLRRKRRLAAWRARVQASGAKTSPPPPDAKGPMARGSGAVN